MPSSPETLHDHYFGAQHVTVIEPSTRWLDLRELWAYRELLGTLALRQVRVRYKQTLLGVAWAIIQPLVQMVIFTVIFGRMAKMPSEGFPYPVFVYSGLLAWNYFASSTALSISSLVANASLISKVYFPRLIIPLSAVLSGLIDFAVAFVVMLGLMLYYGVAPTAGILLLPVLLLGVMLTVAGVGAGLGALNVEYRDLQHAMPFLIQVWLYLTPVVYPPAAVPEALRWVLDLNPMTGLVDAIRAAILGRPFDLPAIGRSVAIGGAIFVAGVTYFQRMERRFADVV